MEFKDRFKQLLDIKGVSNYKIWQDTKLSKTTIANYLSGAPNPTPSNIRVLANYFKVNEDWLLNGVGERDKSDSKENSAIPVAGMISRIPLVNQYAYAGYVSGYSDSTYVDQLPKVPFLLEQEGNGNYMAFEVKGDSMNDGTENSYLEGDRLYCREIPKHLWATSKLHLRKWDFIIVHEDGILLKQITSHDVEKHTIIIHSLNDMYPDKPIDLREVFQIFNVIESVRPRRR